MHRGTTQVISGVSLPISQAPFFLLLNHKILAVEFVDLPMKNYCIQAPTIAVLCYKCSGATGRLRGNN